MLINQNCLICQANTKTVQCVVTERIILEGLHRPTIKDFL